MIRSFIQLYEYRGLVAIITWRDIKVKYKQSVMGFLWAIFMPMIIISAGILVKFAFSIISNKPLLSSSIMSVSVKSLPWAFFVGTIRFSSNSLIQNTSLVTKIYFPKLVFPISALLSQLFDFLVASVVLIIVLSFFKIGITLLLLWVPLLILILITFTLSLGILFSAGNLFFRDVKYIVEVILTFAIFFTPVFYEVEIFGKWGDLLLLNPVAPILEGLNTCIVQHSMPNTTWILYSTIISVVLFFISIKTFTKLEPLFAESI